MNSMEADYTARVLDGGDVEFTITDRSARSRKDRWFKVSAQEWEDISMVRRAVELGADSRGEL